LLTANRWLSKRPRRPGWRAATEVLVQAHCPSCTEVAMRFLLLEDPALSLGRASGPAILCAGYRHESRSRDHLPLSDTGYVAIGCSRRSSFFAASPITKTQWPPNNRFRSKSKLRDDSLNFPYRSNPLYRAEYFGSVAPLIAVQRRGAGKQRSVAAPPHCRWQRGGDEYHRCSLERGKPVLRDALRPPRQKGGAKS
jgi:hypothetical protein